MPFAAQPGRFACGYWSQLESSASMAKNSEKYLVIAKLNCQLGN
jgi:hypothetical protein